MDVNNLSGGMTVGLSQKHTVILIAIYCIAGFVPIIISFARDHVYPLSNDVVQVDTNRLLMQFALLLFMTMCFFYTLYCTRIKISDDSVKAVSFGNVRRTELNLSEITKISTLIPWVVCVAISDKTSAPLSRKYYIIPSKIKMDDANCLKKTRIYEENKTCLVFQKWISSGVVVREVSPVPKTSDSDPDSLKNGSKTEPKNSNVVDSKCEK